ncbi:MAG TPA: M24 family metallopeptidase [Pseudolabrys sp.]|nr:M24 family metallopeptidase [Pseudolabrys sp.]
MSPAPPLPSGLQRIVDAEYPRFSDAEMARHRAAVEALLREAQCDHLVFCGAQRFGSIVQYLTRWPITAEAVGVFTPGKRDALFVQWINHEPQAAIIAKDADVAWGGESSIGAAVGVLEKRGAGKDRVAYIGPLSATQYLAIADKFGVPKNLNRPYTRHRLVKSAEELDWMRIGAYFTDLGMAGLRDGVRPGLKERELDDLIERAYVKHGAVNFIHYIGVTAMRAPDLGVPRQFPLTRTVEKGDVVVAEITATFWDYPGQVLRSFAINEEPSPLYRDLHAAADAAFDAITNVLKAGATPAQVIDASSVIEDAGFTIIDDLLHGYGGGYLPPILGCTNRPAGPVPQEPFRAGQTVVVQPNVVTKDRKAGVQTGEMLLITETGVERFHSIPRGFAVI